MRGAGIDIGSRAIKLAVVEHGRVVESFRADAGHDPLGTARTLMGAATFDRILATGYGRTRFEIEFDTPTLTEIKAHARGARHCFPDAATVLDIGGQDTKVIVLGPDGKVVRFEMNDRCAAGTGRFMEMMARSLGYSLEEFALAALEAERDVAINSMCAVFAESEVVALMARGEDRRNIALGVHQSIARRTASMIRQAGSGRPLVFCGGVAANPCLRRLLEDALQHEIRLAPDPQMTGALGAALHAADDT